MDQCYFTQIDVTYCRNCFLLQCEFSCTILCAFKFLDCHWWLISDDSCINNYALFPSISVSVIYVFIFSNVGLEFSSNVEFKFIINYLIWFKFINYLNYLYLVMYTFHMFPLFSINGSLCLWDSIQNCF